MSPSADSKSAGKRRIKMLLPVPMPPEALPRFAAQIPAHLMRPGIEVEFFGTRNGAYILDSLYESALADAFVVEAGMRAEHEGYDAICVNSMSDSGVAPLRSLLKIPVLGSAHSSFLAACMLAKKFSVITMWEPWKLLYDKVITAEGLHHRVASIRSIGVRPDTAALLEGKEQVVFGKLEEAGRRAIEEDGAEVLILGSTTMHQSHAHLAERMPVPVINPGLVAFELCLMFLDLGLTHSKKAYPPPERVDERIFDQVPKRF
ncbi:MAG TPA: aspartate/glutamate racemase family protein [Candidatus Binataceae bacterium]|nr:aspartate/glutamate racemase family protein [Candidatus Binataceae bacterium]